jgi:hypothetical protein
MPVTILNPHRSEPWANAIQGLSGALDAYQRYKSEDREHKLRVEAAALRREESEQRRKERDQDMAFREHQLSRQAEEEAIQVETERGALGENLGIAKGAADLSGLVNEATKTPIVAPSLGGLSATLGNLSKPPTAKTPEVGGPPTADIESPATTGPFGGKRLSLPSLTLGGGEAGKPAAPLEAMIAPQLDPNAPITAARDALASRQADTEAEYATPTGKPSPRDRALGRQAIADRQFRREVAESERKEKVGDARLAAREASQDKRLEARDKAHSELQAQRDKAAAERAERQQAAALERAAIAAAKGNREAATSADVDHLAAGGTLASIPPSRRTVAAQAARREGISVFETPGQQKAYNVADASLSEAAELKRLLSDPEVKSAFGPIAGRWNTSATSGWLSSWPGEIPNSVRRAIQLAQNLNDLRLRQRSGAAISESEAARLGKFSFDPTVPVEQMLVNIDPYISELEAIKTGNSSSGTPTKKKDPNDPVGLDDGTAPESGIKRPPRRP